MRAGHALSPAEKRSIINYIQTVKDMRDPGGAGIGRIGPVSEGLVIWTVGLAAQVWQAVPAGTSSRRSLWQPSWSGAGITSR